MQTPAKMLALTSAMEGPTKKVGCKASDRERPNGVIPFTTTSHNSCVIWFCIFTIGTPAANGLWSMFILPEVLACVNFPTKRSFC